MAKDVFIIGLGMIRFGKYLDKGIKALTGEALKLVLDDCGLAHEDIEAAWFSNSAWGMSAFQHSIRGQVALSVHGLEGIPITNVENACASASTALHGAWTAVRAGLYDCALAIGVEKLHDPDRTKVMMGFITGTDVEVTMDMIAKFQKEEQERREREAREKGIEPPQEKPGGHSAFMDLYAMGARMHMKQYGTTQRQLACIASKNHNNSVLNPLAQYTFPMTVEEVLADREVAYPLTRAMCAPIGDGAAAAIVCSGRFLKKVGKQRAIRIRASVLQSGTRVRANDITARTSRIAYEAAGLGPADIDVAEVHDATAYGELYQTEQLGFCPVGEGGPFVEGGATALGGTIPVNPSGGLIARGHPVGASGLAQIYELGTHLRGEAGKRQVAGARIALAENGGGFLGQGEAAMMIHILEKA
ncbi:MAG: thiolase family protein [Deltaproteobacteria bacterium]|nr:thiolase family protein [Deltaproteobacteria bacterium]